MSQTQRASSTAMQHCYGPGRGKSTGGYVTRKPHGSDEACNHCRAVGPDGGRGGTGEGGLAHCSPRSLPRGPRAARDSVPGRDGGFRSGGGGLGHSAGAAMAMEQRRGPRGRGLGANPLNAKGKGRRRRPGPWDTGIAPRTSAGWGLGWAQSSDYRTCHGRIGWRIRGQRGQEEEAAWVPRSLPRGMKRRIPSEHVPRDTGPADQCRRGPWSHCGTAAIECLMGRRPTLSAGWTRCTTGLGRLGQPPPPPA